MGSRQRRGPYAKTEVRRRELSDAALSLVLERGHNAFTAEDVAQATGASVPTVFYHFPTKVDLLVAALQRFDDLRIEPLTSSGALAVVGDQALEGVHRTNLVRLYTELAGESADPGHPAHEYFTERWVRSNRVLAEDIRRLQKSGELPEAVDAAHVARCVLAAWEGLQLAWLRSPDFDIRATLNSLIASLVATESVGATPSSRT
jgi:AcrR family transcriptional regulator